MRRLLILCAAILACTSVYAWGIREHATVAQIAENNLTPKAKALVKEYFKGKPMAYYASMADQFREEMLIDAGFEPADGNRMVAFSHAFYVDNDLKPFASNADSEGKVVKNTLLDMTRLAKNLKENHRTMNDSVRLVHLYLIIHGMGDMHCPMHVGFNYGEPNPHGKYRVYLMNGTKQSAQKLHGLWEGRMISAYCPWTYTDLASALDTHTQEQKDKICEGEFFAWGEDSAKSAILVYNEYPEESEITKNDFHKKFQSLAEELIAKAGYRLAKVFNDILN